MQGKEAAIFYEASQKKKVMEALKDNFVKKAKKNQRERHLKEFKRDKEEKRLGDIFKQFIDVCNAHRLWLQSVRDQLDNLRMG